MIHVEKILKAHKYIWNHKRVDKLDTTFRRNDGENYHKTTLH